MADLNPTLEVKPNVPKIKLGPVTSGPEAQAGGKGNEFATVSSSHNTYRPDIYRTSEGYMS